MNRFKPYLSLCLSIMAIMCSQYTTADSCTAEDTRYAKVWDNYYSPQEAYNVGKILQLLVANKDTRGLYQYVDGELENGPRRSYALSKPFDEVFPEKWVESILSNEPNCSPVGWRGFLLGNGNIWFNKRNGEWKIRAINSASKETITTPSGWSVNHQVLPPSCFSYPWISGDNFEEYADRFHIKDITRFMASPGDYIDSEIHNYQPITTEWCNNGDCRKITLMNSLKTCASGEFEKELSDHGVSVKITDKNGVSVSTAYYLLKAVNTKICNRLAPHIKSQCKSSYLLRVGDYSGGSMGWYFSTGIYGVFDLPGVGLSMVPLRFFPNDNEGLNFLDRQPAHL